MSALAVSLPVAEAQVVIDNGDSATVPGDYASPWSLDDLTVGNLGTGTLTVENGGVVEIENYLVTGREAGSLGSVVVTGAGSRIEGDDLNLFIGHLGAGALEIRDGGIVESASGRLGMDAGSLGIVKVNGPGSQWSAPDVYIGRGAGRGDLIIEAGGRVESGRVIMGLVADSVGTAVVSGAGSVWDIGAGQLFLGDNGAATLTVDAGGEVLVAGDVTIGERLEGSGVLNLKGDAVNGRGALSTSRIVQGEGGAQINFDGGVLKATTDEADFISLNGGSVDIRDGGAFIDTNGFEVGIAADLTGTGGLTKQGQGTLALSGSNTYSGVTTIESGRLELRSTTANAGSGSLSGDVVNDGVLAAYMTERRVELASNISGSGSVEIYGADDYTYSLVMSGDNTYTGGTVIDGGGLVLASTSGGSGIVGNIVNDGYLEFAYQNDVVVSNNISGHWGLIRKSGDNTVRLTGVSSYSGTVQVMGGRLELKTVTVKGGGSLHANVSLARGATLATFASKHMLELSGNIYGEGSVEINGGDGHYYWTVMNGDNTYTGGTFIGLDGGLWLESSSGGSGVVGDIVNTGQLMFGFLDDAVVSNNISGSGIVRVDGEYYGITVRMTGANTYTGATWVEGGRLELEANSTPGSGSLQGDIVLDSGTELATFALDHQLDLWGDISGEGAVEINGGGQTPHWTVMHGDNSYTGGTLINENGALALASSSGGSGLVGEIVNNGGLMFAYADDAVVSNDISGTGFVRKTEGTNVTLTGVNSYTGETSVEGGRLEVRTSSAAGSGSLQGNVQIQEGAVLSLSAEHHKTEFPGDISGTGALEVGAGNWWVVLNGDNSYTGGTFIREGGALALAGLSPTGGIVGDVSNDGQLMFGSDVDVTYGGVISGKGAVWKDIDGTVVTLTGENTYTGGTLITHGAVQIGDGGSRGSILGPVHMLGDAQLIFNRSDTQAVSNSFSGQGSVLFTGGGTYLFSGDGGYTGAIGATNATLALQPGAASNAAFSINGNALLTGNGTLGALTANEGGVIAPGNSPGTIHVNGDVAFNAGSIYRVDIELSDMGGPRSANLVSDRIVAGGNALLSGQAAIDLAAAPDAYRAGDTFNMLSAAGTVTGQFGPVSHDFAFLTPTLSADAQNVYLTLAYDDNSPRFAGYADTGNERSVANAAQLLGAGNPVFDAIAPLRVGAVGGVFNALSGEVYASVNTVIQQQSGYVRDAVGSRLRQASPFQGEGQPGSGVLAYAGQASAPATAMLGPDMTPTLWAQGFGSSGNTRNDGNAATISNNLGGFIIGADVAVAPDVWAGLFGGYSRSSFDVDDRASSGHINNYDIGAYAGARFGQFALRGGLAYGWHDVSADRNIQFSDFNQSAEASYDTGTTQIFGEASYDVAIGAYELQPFAGLAYLNVANASFTEKYSTVGLRVDSGSMNTLYSTLGVRMATSMSLGGHTLTPSLSIGWQHAFGDTTPESSMLFPGGATPFQISGVPVAEDALLLDIGAAYELSPSASLAVSYNGQLGSGAQQNAFTAQFSMKF